MTIAVTVMHVHVAKASRRVEGHVTIAVVGDCQDQNKLYG